MGIFRNDQLVTECDDLILDSKRAVDRKYSKNSQRVKQINNKQRQLRKLELITTKVLQENSFDDQSMMKINSVTPEQITERMKPSAQSNMKRETVLHKNSVHQLKQRESLNESYQICEDFQKLQSLPQGFAMKKKQSFASKDEAKSFSKLQKFTHRRSQSKVSY